MSLGAGQIVVVCMSAGAGMLVVAHTITIRAIGDGLIAVGVGFCVCSRCAVCVLDVGGNIAGA